MQFMPMGSPFSFEVVSSAFQFMLKSNRNSQIARIENVPEEQLSIFNDMGFQSIPKETEYIYRTENLAELRGNRYKQQRMPTILL